MQKYEKAFNSGKVFLFPYISFNNQDLRINVI